MARLSGRLPQPMVRPEQAADMRETAAPAPGESQPQQAAPALRAEVGDMANHVPYAFTPLSSKGDGDLDLSAVVLLSLQQEFLLRIVRNTDSGRVADLPLGWPLIP